MSKNARAGGKYTGNHTTLIPAALIVCDILERCAGVTKISPGFIKAGLRPPRDGRRVKLDERDGYLLLTVRDITSQQELHVYTTDTETTRLLLVEGIKKKGLTIVVRI